MAAEFKNGCSTIRANLKRCAEEILFIHQNHKTTEDVEEFKESLMENLADMMELESEAAKIDEIYEKISQNLRENDQIPDDKALQEMWRSEEKALGRKKFGDRKPFKDAIKSIRDGEVEKEAEEDEEMQVMQVQHSRKDPISKKDIVNPVINRKCGHVYDRDSIVEFAGSKRQINCAMQGCSEKITVAKMDDYPEYWQNIKQQN